MDLPKDYRDCQTLGQRLRWWRRKRGIERPELAKKAKVKLSTLGDVENEFSKSTKKITALAGALEINPHYLATGEGDPYDVKMPPPPPDAASNFASLFPLSELQDLDATELELARFKFHAVVRDIKELRPKQRKARAG